LAVSLHRVRFLLVDDNIHMMNIVKTMLRGFGGEKIFEAKTADEALDRLRHDAVDIVILDYLLGDTDGTDFCRQVRTSPDSPAPYVPVIMLTGHSEKSRVQTARDAGVTEFCVKPVTAADLLRKVAAVIDRPRPFVRSPSYFGPDRRRAANAEYAGPERRGRRGGSET
jgi:CheY-like chemotaxis protein